jgi:competence protein ComEA
MSKEWLYAKKKYIIVIGSLLLLFLSLNNSEEMELVVSETSEGIYIDIKGAVANPGVYHLEKGARYFDAIEAAGGFNNANEECVNQAKEVEDGQEIYIQAIDESCHHDGAIIVNINKANEKELTVLPGIGDATAKKIIDYRNEQGEFKSIEELQEVEGIGPSTFEDIEEYIVVD